MHLGSYGIEVLLCTIYLGATRLVSMLQLEIMVILRVAKEWASCVVLCD